MGLEGLLQDRMTCGYYGKGALDEDLPTARMVSTML